MKSFGLHFPEGFILQKRTAVRVQQSFQERPPAQPGRLPSLSGAGPAPGARAFRTRGLAGVGNSQSSPSSWKKGLPAIYRGARVGQGRTLRCPV